MIVFPLPIIIGIKYKRVCVCVSMVKGIIMVIE